RACVRVGGRARVRACSCARSRCRSGPPSRPPLASLFHRGVDRRYHGARRTNVRWLFLIFACGVLATGPARAEAQDAVDDGVDGVDEVVPPDTPPESAPEEPPDAGGSAVPAPSQVPAPSEVEPAPADADPPRSGPSRTETSGGSGSSPMIINVHAGRDRD